MLPVLPPATATSDVLFIHAPYPGALRFEGQPSSLLHAATPFLRREVGDPGLLDPGNASESWYEELRSQLADGRARAVCISTSTVAIEQTARIVKVVRDELGPDCFIVVGGPHEDGCDQKVASRMPGVDLSIAGNGEHVLSDVLCEFRSARQSPGEFSRGLPGRFSKRPPAGGRVQLTSPWLDRSHSADFGVATAVRPRAWSESIPSFAPLGGRQTLPLMVSQGCAYGRCTFCAEASRGGVLLDQDFSWVKEVVAAWPDASLYFQDSIFPSGNRVQQELLPLLRGLGRPWGAQVYLPLLREHWVSELADAGCVYLYTGVETAAESLLPSIGKREFELRAVFERLRWMVDCGMQVGVSLMLGVMNTRGELAESAATVSKTLEMARALKAEFGPRIHLYPNVQTVLPGTALARGVAEAGRGIDFYTVPRVPAFDQFEDGGHGYNFASMQLPGWEPVAEAVQCAGHEIERLMAERNRWRTDSDGSSQCREPCLSQEFRNGSI